MWSRFQRSLCTKVLKIEESILRHTKISRDHLTPELALHLLTPDCPLYNAKMTHEVKYFEEPFWSIYWPGGQVLARYLLDEGPQLFRELSERRGGAAIKVLDIGTGCGAAAIAAKIAGASDVLANDIDEVACTAALKNARLNNVKIRASAVDLLDRELPEVFDVVLIGDLLYDEAIAARLETWLDKHVLCENSTSEIYLADPGRHGLTTKFRRKLDHLRTYRLPENVRRENHGYNEATVWKFLSRSQS